MKKNKGIIAEFRRFISRGNVMDMAVGVIMGTAFTAVVNSAVKDLIMPWVGYIINGINFSDLKIVLKAAEGETPEVAVGYGAFIQQALNFLIIAAVVFLMVKIINILRRKSEDKEAAAPVSKEVELLAEIRDLMKGA